MKFTIHIHVDYIHRFYNGESVIYSVNPCDGYLPIEITDYKLVIFRDGARPGSNYILPEVALR